MRTNGELLSGLSADIFISHAGRDKDQYINSLADALAERGVTYWLDTVEIGWGDNIVMKINEGLADSRFALVCLSANFLERGWPEAELSGAFALQTDSGRKRVLPLILNSKAEVLARYPLLAGLAYREFSTGVDLLANEIANLAGSSEKSKAGQIRITIEGVHTGKIASLDVPLRASVRWLREKAQAGMEVRSILQAGPFSEFHIRWVLVDVRAEEAWRAMSRHAKRGIHAMVFASGDKPRISCSERDRLSDLGLDEGTVFHLYAVEDEDYYETHDEEAEAEE